MTARALLVLVAISLVGASCGGSDDGSSTDPDLPVIVATTSVWADIVSNLACDGLAETKSLVPVGADPHSFELSLRDRGELEDASLVVANGLGLEAGLGGVLDDLAGSDVSVIRAGDFVDPIDTNGVDPHIWMDPSLVVSILPSIASAMVTEGGFDEAWVNSCLDTYLGELAEADAEAEEILSAISPTDRVLVTSHDSLSYFARRYSLEVVGTIIPSTSSLAEPNPEELEQLIATIDTYAVPAIFAETQVNDDLADSLASRSGGIEIVALYTGSLGLEGSGADTYVGLIVTDAKLIADALS